MLRPRQEGYEDLIFTSSFIPRTINRIKRYALCLLVQIELCQDNYGHFHKLGSLFERLRCIK